MTQGRLLLLCCLLLLFALGISWRQILVPLIAESDGKASRDSTSGAESANLPDWSENFAKNHKQPVLPVAEMTDAPKPVATGVKPRPEVQPGTAAKPQPLLSHDPLVLWQHWQSLSNHEDYQQIPVVNASLADHLHKQNVEQVYREIEDLLNQPAVPIQNKALLIDLLTDIATPQALDQLIALAQRGVSDPLYMLLVQAISRIGDNRWDGRFHEELSPALETAWSNPPENNKTFLNAVGSAIAKVGAPQGVNELLLTVTGKTAKPVKDDTEKIKQEVAFQVIPKVRNPTAVPVLNTFLTQEPVGNPGFEASGAALAEINTPKATEVLMDWAKTAPDEAARNAQEWLEKKADDTIAATTIQNAQSADFKSAEIASVVSNIAPLTDFVKKKP